MDLPLAKRTRAHHIGRTDRILCVWRNRKNLLRTVRKTAEAGLMPLLVKIRDRILLVTPLPAVDFMAERVQPLGIQKRYVPVFHPVQKRADPGSPGRDLDTVGPPSADLLNARDLRGNEPGRDTHPFDTEDKSFGFWQDPIGG